MAHAISVCLRTPMYVDGLYGRTGLELRVPDSYGQYNTGTRARETRP